MKNAFCIPVILLALVSTTKAEESNRDSESSMWNIWVGEQVASGEIVRGPRGEFSRRLEKSEKYTVCWALPGVVMYSDGDVAAIKLSLADLEKRVPDDVAKIFRDQLACVTVSEFSEESDTSVAAKLELHRFHAGKARLAGSMSRTFQSEHLYETFPEVWVQFIRD